MKRNHLHSILKKDSLLYMASCWNADSYLIETDEQIDEIWNEISENGFHQIEFGTDDYDVACAQLDLKYGFPILNQIIIHVNLEV